MAGRIVMPRLGWTMEEGALVEWLKQDGDRVEAGEILFTVETDKALNEVQSFETGTLRIPPDSPPPGAKVPVGTLLAYVVEPGEPVPFERLAVPGEPGASVTAGVGRGTTAHVPSGPPPRSVEAVRQAASTISPRARRVAAELGVEWTGLAGSGRTGRIVERDVRAAATQMAAAAPEASTLAAQTAEPLARIKASPLARRLAEEAGLDLTALAASKPGATLQREDVEAAIAARTTITPRPAPLPRVGETRPITPVRRLIAQRLSESVHTTAAVTLTTEADASELAALHNRLKSTLTPLGRTAPTYNDLMIKLTAVALGEHPLLNASWQEEGIIIHSGIHLGIAVDTEAGLMVPVIRDVSAKTLQQIATESAALAEKARMRTLGPDDLQGGTFTITNLGMYGIDAFTPIINLPQCAILGVGRMISKPAVHNDQVVPRQMMALSLTFDHRVVDGGPAARFLNTVREYVENPYLWLTQ
ncbi:MAG: 2-oxo acid dehydrogenase subunit E2 [Armatimonadetes bacterium]|nr:2-oxo acid dehydrogenase subunit E2 [Armatimonadota bacterium]